MKKFQLIFLLALGSFAATGQQYGLSFSYFLPKNGSFSTPVSPFSIRGLGVDFGKHFSLQTGASLYRMTGLGVKGLPFKTSTPIAGPNFTVFIPGELVLRFQGRQAEFDLKAGGFVFNGFLQKLNEGHLDRALRDHEGWKVVNSDFSTTARPGFGWQAGAELTINVTRQWGLSLEVNYLAGGSPLRMKGTYFGYDQNDLPVSREADFKKAKVDLTGLEFSIGILMGGR